jgi:hypothetical protein
MIHFNFINLSETLITLISFSQNCKILLDFLCMDAMHVSDFNLFLVSNNEMLHMRRRRKRPTSYLTPYYMHDARSIVPCGPSGLHGPLVSPHDTKRASLAYCTTLRTLVQLGISSLFSLILYLGLFYVLVQCFVELFILCSLYAYMLGSGFSYCSV